MFIHHKLKIQLIKPKNEFKQNYFCNPCPFSSDNSQWTTSQRDKISGK